MIAIKIRILLIISLLLSVTVIYGGFSAGTLIKTHHGYVNIETIQTGDIVVCYDPINYRQINCPVLKTQKTRITDPVIIIFNNCQVITSRDQKFYCASTMKWLNVLDIQNDKDVQQILNIRAIQTLCDSIDIFEISVGEFHNFYITECDILVHNFLMITPAVVILSLPIVKMAMSTIFASGLFAFGVKNISKYKASKQKCFSECDSPDPQDLDNDEESFFKKLIARSDKKAKTRYGKIYRDSTTKLWWSKDRARHGGSCFKVYKQKAKGFEFLFDADAQGNIIPHKHKGPVGIFIPNKDVAFLA